MTSKKRRTNKPPKSIALYEAEVLPGLKTIAEAELTRRFARQIHLLRSEREDQIGFHYLGDPQLLQQLQTIIAVYQIAHFDVPRPRALLGHQHLQRLLKQITTLLSRYPAHTFHTFRISAAGQDSTIFNRLKDEIAQHTRLTLAEDEADLVLRIRGAIFAPTGWEVLVRLTPRPLATRPWRVHDMPGALNATIAAAMIALTQPHPTDRFLNLMCGSGTLLIERLRHSPAQAIIGGELNPTTLTLAQSNIQAAQLNQPVTLLNLDATATPFPAASFDVISIDLPWGQLIGSHQENAQLYPQVLAEATRLARPQARLLIITHQIKQFDQAIANYANEWRCHTAQQVYQGGLHPKIYALQLTH